jgi:AmmeMemoRadiSam system protein A
MSSLPEKRFSPEDQRAMLDLARAAIVGAFTARPARAPDPPPACLALRRGVFVTIEVKGRLRGCIGVVEAEAPLAESIRHCAESAAFRDPRFPSLAPEEISDLRVEISVLSALSEISPEAVEIGKHGLLVDSGDRRGLLLPQVATEHRLTREQFLEETCRKAGLPPGAWRTAGTRLFAFTCDVFQEDPAP